MQKINLKKTTKEQMLAMLETAWQENAGANEEIAALSKRIEEQNDALAKCVAEKNELREQLADTEAALGRANAEVSHYKSELRIARKAATDAQWAKIYECRRANYAEAHPWRNLWAWVKRKLVRHE